MCGTNNPSPLTQSHTQPPGAAAQPAEPRPNLARRGAEPSVYIAHPTHGAGTRPNRTQPPAAAQKTTLNAGQCVRQPWEGRGRNRQAPPPQKKQQGGEGGGRKQPTAAKLPANTTRGGRTPPQKAPKTGSPKRHRGTTQRKPATPSQEQRPTRRRDTGTCRHTPEKIKKSQQPSPKESRWGDRDHKARDRDTQQPTPQKKKRKKHTPTTQLRRAGHSRDPGPARTPTTHAGTGNGGGQAERARNHTRPISRPKPNANHEHHKQPTLEGQHHKPCPNTPTQDPSQDWRG